MTWKPHVTVAAVIERDGKFLMVEEIVNGKTVYNQPAGHLENDESLINAVIREVLEETAWEFRPEQIIGIYRQRTESSDRTYLRICFSGQCIKHFPEQALDKGILSAPWLSHDELIARQDKLRSPMVIKCINDYLTGQNYPMELIHDMENL